MLSNFFANNYLWIKSFHLFAVISWMVGLLYLPRIFAYHTKVVHGSESDILFRTMERRLMKIIMNPSMIVTIILGLILADIYGFASLGKWFHMKMLVVMILMALHMAMSKWRRNFDEGKNTKSEKFFKMLNEVPAILMLFAIILVIVKPFE